MLTNSKMPLYNENEICASKGKKIMWTPSKSVVLSAICTKLVIALVICFAVAAPTLVGSYFTYTARDSATINSLLITLYACCVPAMIALLSLDRLLANIKKSEVFIEKNVRHLRLISWCCFLFSFILAVSGFYFILLLIIAVAAAFFGLILRVVKNVIEQAMIIKQENDYTI